MHREITHLLCIQVMQLYFSEGKMADQNDFFTWQSVATFVGTTTATTAVTNGLARAFPQLPSARVGLVVAIIICVATSLVDFGTGEITWSKPFGTYLIAIINGFLVFSSSAGVSAGGAAIVANAQDRDQNLRDRNLRDNEGVNRSFWRRWF